MTTSNSDKLMSYLSEIKNQASNVMIDGYFPVNAVIDAFTKGEKSGAEQVLEELKEQFMRASTQMFLYGNDFIKEMEKKGFSFSGFYVNPFGFKFMVTTSIENTCDENFIDVFYETSGNYECKFKSEFGINMRIQFIQDQNLNEDVLRIDGFIKPANGEA